MLIQFSGFEVDREWLPTFESDPQKACGYMAVMKVALRDSPQPEDLLAWLETNHTVWAERDSRVRDRLISSGFMNDTVIWLCRKYAQDCVVTAKVMARLLSGFQCLSDWVGHPTRNAHAAKFKEIAKCFCQICIVGCEEDQLLEIFLSTARRFVFGDHVGFPYCFAELYAQHLTLAWTIVFNKIEGMKYSSTKEKLHAYLKFSKKELLSLGDTRSQARGLEVVFKVVSEEVKREKTEIPAVIGALLQRMLAKESLERKDYFLRSIVEYIGGRSDGNKPELKTKYEKTCGYPSQRRITAWELWMLEHSHAVYDYMDENIGRSISKFHYCSRLRYGSNCEEKQDEEDKKSKQGNEAEDSDEECTPCRPSKYPRVDEYDYDHEVKAEKLEFARQYYIQQVEKHLETGISCSFL
ncbi:unnamed protein product [Cylindrotheca closterium]|uniref:Uncharacterized protein n=1 Tax=Cylindrotheca closterium TaxID=2856 RepID=A0AAD2JPT5_9STRA|nr:unnamed protein product [Cylindrotheca closterium]